MLHTLPEIYCIAREILTEDKSQKWISWSTHKTEYDDRNYYEKYNVVTRLNDTG